MDTVTIGKSRINNLSFAQAVDRIEKLILSRLPSYVVTPNVDHIVQLENDIELRSVYEKASLVLADGMPLLWAAHYLGTPIKQKISGSDLLPVLCSEAAKKGYRVFFLGGRPGAADQAAIVLREKHPTLNICGTYCPPYCFESDAAENKHVIQLIKQCVPDLLFVGLGAPKQEKWISNYKKEYNVPVSIGVGGSFEFISGYVKRAPLWMQHAGLEWFWRLLQEPNRLWKRYLVDDIGFLKIIYCQKQLLKNKGA